jgi:hypothetical protein
MEQVHVHVVLLEGKIALNEIQPVLNYLRGTFMLQGMHQLRSDRVKSKVLECQ